MEPKETPHIRSDDVDYSFHQHRRHSDKLLESLLKNLATANTMLGELSGKVDVGLKSLDNKIDTHIRSEEGDISKFKQDFYNFKSDVTKTLNSIESTVKEIQPIIKSNKEKDVIWNWATEKVPKFLTTIYKFSLYVGAVVITGWAFIEYIVHNKLGK